MLINFPTSSLSNNRPESPMIHQLMTLVSTPHTPAHLGKSASFSRMLQHGPGQVSRPSSDLVPKTIRQRD
jgi:hypothetical protein